jgi:hypothetical protein
VGLIWEQFCLHSDLSNKIFYAVLVVSIPVSVLQGLDIGSVHYAVLCMYLHNGFCTMVPYHVRTVFVYLGPGPGHRQRALRGALYTMNFHLIAVCFVGPGPGHRQRALRGAGLRPAGRGGRQPAGQGAVVRAGRAAGRRQRAGGPLRGQRHGRRPPLPNQAGSQGTVNFNS